VVTIFAPVFDQATPWPSAFQGIPHIAESLSRHIRMPHNIVRLLREFFSRKAGYRNEVLVTIYDATLVIGTRYENRTGLQFILSLSYWLIIAHVNPAFRISHVLEADIRRSVNTSLSGILDISVIPGNAGRENLIRA
jgi:hypothetical protein